MRLLITKEGDMRRNLSGIILGLGVTVFTACGSSSSSSGGTTVNPSDVTVSTADGATGISTISFSDTVTWPSGNAVDADTVTSTSFYVVPATVSAQVTRGDWSAGNCVVDNALSNIELDTSVDGGTSSSTLTILEDLADGTTYYVCLTTAITFSDGASFAGMTNSFVTAGVAEFALASSDITDGGTIPQVNANATCGGSNKSPQMTWTNPPDGTLGYAITVIDEDADTFIHWILYNIPSTTTELDQNSGTPTGASTVQNGYGDTGYGGPCPPVDEAHTYEFTVYALDVADATTISGFDNSSNTEFISTISSNTLDTATFRGNYTGQ